MYEEFLCTSNFFCLRNGLVPSLDCLKFIWLLLACIWEVLKTELKETLNDELISEVSYSGKKKKTSRAELHSCTMICKLVGAPFLDPFMHSSSNYAWLLYFLLSSYFFDSKLLFALLIVSTKRNAKGVKDQSSRFKSRQKCSWKSVVQRRNVRQTDKTYIVNAPPTNGWYQPSACITVIRG